MTDKKVLWIRIIIAIAAFIVLCRTLIPFIKSMSLKFQGPIIYLILLLLSFATLANGVSYLSEIFKKHRNILKILTGILSLIIFVFTFFPQDQGTNLIIQWIILIGLSLTSILISVCSLFEFTQVFAIMRVYSFVFALISGIYSCLILSFIFRGYNHSEAGIIFMIYGLILFIVSTIVNLIAVSSFKNRIRGNS
jgi:hypothetical protein